MLELSKSTGHETLTSPLSASFVSRQLPRYAVKSCSLALFCAMMLSTGVFCGVGETVLMELNARPSSPLPLPSANCCESSFASSTAWFSTLRPPKLTTSVPTSPLADEESPYEIFHVSPSSFLNVLDFEGSKATCCFDASAELRMFLGSSVDQTCIS